MSTALEVAGLSHAVPTAAGRLELLLDVGLTVSGGEVLAVTGRSGSGKSTLLALMGLLTRPERGSVFVGGRDTGDLSDRQRSRVRNRQIGFVFQNYSLLPHLSAAENVALPLTQSSRKDRGGPIKESVHAALETVGLADRAGSLPRHLSGGEQQRVAIARAVAGSPAVILADEPTGALDADTAERVMRVLLDAVRSRAAALVIVTHDPAVAAQADRVLHLSGGQLSDPDAS